jgi:hypothetical protein
VIPILNESQEPGEGLAQLTTGCEAREEHSEHHSSDILVGFEMPTCIQHSTCHDPFVVHVDAY